MGAAYFYQLSERPLDLALPQLLEKALGAGWRVEVRAALPADLSYLDDMLWAKPEDGFLPHTLAGTQGEDATPIVISEHPLPDRECLMTVMGAETDAKEITSRTRTCVIFDGQKQEELQTARALWKSLSQDNCEAQYWAEDRGRWVKKAETSSIP